MEQNTTRCRRFVAEIKVVPQMAHNLIRSLCESKVTSYDIEVYEPDYIPTDAAVKGTIKAESYDFKTTIKIYERCY